jgi:CheY-like chemotaxis protein
MKRILIIDDNKDVRDYLRRILERGGYEVLDASNGKDGIRIFEDAQIDLVITDMLMPTMDGAETILRLRSLAENPKIIAISGGGASLATDVCLRVGELAGASLALDKPIDRLKLIETVRGLIGGES